MRLPLPITRARKDGYEKVHNETLLGSKAYTLVDMMDDLRRGIWSELSRGRNIDTYRRNLQRAYIDRLAYLMTAKNQPKLLNFGRYTKGTKVNISQSDIRSVVRGELGILKRAIGVALTKAPNRMTRYHLQDVLKRINNILDPK